MPLCALGLRGLLEARSEQGVLRLLRSGLNVDLDLEGAAIWCCRSSLCPACRTDLATLPAAASYTHRWVPPQLGFLEFAARVRLHITRLDRRPLPRRREDRLQKLPTCL